MVVELLYDFSQRVTEGDEVDDILILIERTGNFCFDPVVMPVDALANITGKGNEVCRAEDKLFFLQQNAITGRTGVC